MYSLKDVYDAFLGKMLEDEWANWTQAEIDADWKTLYNSAIPWFKFPRVSFETDASGNFTDELMSNDEIQIIATYMKCEWLNRTIMTWENVKPLYEERDFSQANLLDSFRLLLKQEKSNGAKLESNYYRSVSGKPYDYSNFTK